MAAVEAGRLADQALDARVSPLLVAAAMGDQLAWGALLELLDDRLARWALRVWWRGSWRVLELADVRQEASLALLELAREYAARQVAGRAPSGGLWYVAKLFRFRLVRRCRQAEGLACLPLVEGARCGEAAALAEAGLMPARVAAAILALPDGLRDVVLLRGLGYSVEAAATELGVSPSTVVQRWARGVGVIRAAVAVETG